MQERDWIYLGQLVRALQLEEVDGTRIGELAVEVEQHLYESGADPVEEFGPPAALARELAQRPGGKRPGWIPPMWLTYLVVALLLLIVVPLLAPWEWSETTIPVTGGAVSYVIVFSTSVFWLGYRATSRLDGRTWNALRDWRFLGSILVLAAVVTLLFNLGSDQVLLELPKVPYLAFAAVSVPALLIVLVRRSNPIRFPDNAQHLNRLKRGMFAGHPPGS